MSKPEKLHLAILAGIILVAAALRFHAIGAQSFWLDELLSLEASCGHGQADQELPHGAMIQPSRLTKLAGAAPAWKVWTTLRKDSHPPLYYLMLRGWRSIVGDGEGAVRTLSALWSIAAIVLIFLVGRRISGAWTGLVAAMLMAISPLQVLYAQEARNYAMLCATTLLAGWAYLRVEEKESRLRMGILGACLVVAMLTHYLAAPVLAGIAIYAGVRTGGWARWRVMATFAVAAVVYAIAWGPFVLEQRDSLRRNSQGSGDVSSEGSLSRTLIRVGCEPLRQLGGQTWEGSPAAPVAAVIVAGLVFAAMIPLRADPKALFAILLLVCPLVFLGTVDLVATDATLRFPRYTVVCSPGLFLLLSWMALRRTRDWRALKVVSIPLVVAAAIYSITALPLSYKPWKADWRSLAEALDHKLDGSDVVVLATDSQQSWWLGGAVLGITHYSSRPMTMMLLEHPASEGETKSLPGGWLILNGTGASPEQILPGFLAVQVGSDAQIGRVYRIMSDRR